MNPWRELRLQMALSQDELGRLLNVSSRTIDRWEEGKKEPSAWQREILVALAASGKRRWLKHVLARRGVAATLAVGLFYLTQ